MDAPLVDMIIAVHTASRPISRAVGSILENTDAPVRVIVVAHNIDAAVISANLGVYAADERVELLELRDGIHSPAGPMNFGIANATAEFFGVMGSDDELAPHALDSWLALQRRSGAGVVIARLQHAGGNKVPDPPVRPRRSIHLDPVKDRLSYRSAPLGIISRARFGDLRFAEGLLSGEDLPFVTRLWFGAAGIAFDRAGPAYLIHADAEDRVTSAPRSVADDFAFLPLILDEPALAHLKRRQRTAIAVKLVRMHLFDAVVNRAGLENWGSGEREALADVARRIVAWGGGPQRYLSLIDHAVLDGILDAVTPVETMMAGIRRRWNYRSLDVIATRNPLYLLARQGPLRTYIGGYLV